jgi:hypothetical protein
MRHILANGELDVARHADQEWDAVNKHDICREGNILIEINYGPWNLYVVSQKRALGCCMSFFL